MTGIMLTAKRNLGVQIVRKKLAEFSTDVQTESVVELMEMAIHQDEDFFLGGELGMCTDHFFSFEVDWVDLPHSICSYMEENYQYYLAGAFLIPGLLPYINELDFAKFTKDHIISVDEQGQDRIEFVHMPSGEFSGIEGFEEFSQQPAVFLLGISDFGNVSPMMILEYFEVLKKFEEACIGYIAGKESRGDGLAQLRLVAS